ncbi:hypothetical protein ABB37_07238 [Leptomonas pyrrhocoris]|uniref:Uncharacterized protein n=1 Tax=Leptomonas pyrrhocoris TaxID=157538 RepID=A0A0M9FWG7_LEPPY|nr:hypothetical protein ABB37_07238 [Leptomonas pyrrhocoris]XP_015655807.1 hypothetical protein ABB37_07238 [Leptomonas pyrrhocoris]KPA77367.1 hypothetical protein ABB37_07238 [Leptomonas pyrrhocoris]KPA77368.1 hypothetical protein ABB37_07238 [Leptomonas pyrrhocoris]|eukprot:XP_015655806.1 hypothetical protein ABB37_07238 [Leptomonas pyrrhocoris]
MWSAHPPHPRTVGDVLRRPFSCKSTLSSAAATRSSLRCPSEERPTFLTEADASLAQRPVRPPSQPRGQSAPGPCKPPSGAPPHLRNDPPSSPPCEGAAPHETHKTRLLQRTRRPVDEALFCALRMEGEGTVAAQLRQLGPERLTSDFRLFCCRLSMHNVTAAQFTFLCAAVLNAAVSQRDCEVVFAFLRTEQGVGSLDVAELLSRLRTLFVSSDVLYALQLKRMLETNALSECAVSMDELQKAFAGLQRLLEPSTVERQVSLQLKTLYAELSRIHAQYAVLVPTFRAEARRLAPALCAVVQSLGWDGAWEDEKKSVALSTTSGAATAATPSAEAACTSPVAVTATSPTVVLSTVTELYRQRLAAQETAEQAREAGRFGGSFGAAACRAIRHSAWRTSDSVVDVTNPHFLADAYATGRVVCSQD